MITIVDYGMGNLRSVYNALDLLGAEAQISDDPAVIGSAERLVLPGVGAFGLAMHNLRQSGIQAALDRAVLERKTPILAICLGMQLLAERSSEHGEHAGLGWLRGHVQHFALDDLCVPHVGWNNIQVQGKPPLLQGITSGKEFYFVHSYHFVTDDASIVAASADYGYEFVCAVHHENIFGTQFHPEKSQNNGLQLLRNFINWEAGVAHA